MATEPGYRLNWAGDEDKLRIISVGTGAAAVLVENVDDPDRGVLGNVAALPSALMYAAMVDQDTNCRSIGRCVHGAPLDREIGDMVPRDDDGKMIPLSQDLGRRFLYARYNADLSREGLDALGLPGIEPKNVQKLDSIKYIPDLRKVGRKVAEEIKIEHFGNFVSP
jgi:hypothetical protein